MLNSLLNILFIPHYETQMIFIFLQLYASYSPRTPDDREVKGFSKTNVLQDLGNIPEKAFKVSIILTCKNLMEGNSLFYCTETTTHAVFFLSVKFLSIFRNINMDL